MSKKHNRTSSKPNLCKRERLPQPAKVVEGFENFVVLYRFMPLSAFEATLETWSLKSTISYEANDPLEVTPKAPFKGSHAHACSTNSPSADLPPFICFSRKITTPSMWGKYADSGKGVCMVFLLPIAPEAASLWSHNVGNDELSDFLARSREAGGSVGFFLKAHGRNITSAVKEVIESSCLMPIRYTQERMMTQENFLKKQNPQNEKELKTALHSWFYELISTKALTWSYEEETRLVCLMEHADEVIGNMALYRWPMRFLAGVVAGPRCPYSISLLEKKIESAYSKHPAKTPVFFSDFYRRILGKSVIVSRATCHWKRFEMECKPWSDRLEGKRVAWAILAGNAAWRLALDAENGSSSNDDISSWNDYQDKMNQEPPPSVIAYGSRVAFEPIKDLKIPGGK